MANEQQYVSVINDGTQDLAIKDAEARESLAGIPSTYATKDELNAAVVGATAAELFTFEVDIATMQLHVYSTASYANAFKIEDGTLKIDLSAMPTT